MEHRLIADLGVVVVATAFLSLFVTPFLLSMFVWREWPRAGWGMLWWLLMALTMSTPSNADSGLVLAQLVLLIGSWAWWVLDTRRELNLEGRCSTCGELLDSYFSWKDGTHVCWRHCPDHSPRNHRGGEGFWCDT